LDTLNIFLKRSLLKELTSGRYLVNHGIFNPKKVSSSKRLNKTNIITKGLHHFFNFFNHLIPRTSIYNCLNLFTQKMYSSFTYTFSHFNIKHSIVYDPFHHYILYTFTWNFGLCYADIYRVAHLAFAFWTIDHFDFDISIVIVNVSDI